MPQPTPRRCARRRSSTGCGTRPPVARSVGSMDYPRRNRGAFRRRRARCRRAGEYSHVTVSGAVTQLLHVRNFKLRCGASVLDRASRAVAKVEPMSREPGLPPVRALVAFEAAARNLNFTRAAEELVVTRVAVSRQVKRLEQHLGVPLFVREPRRLRLTEAGRTALPRRQSRFPPDHGGHAGAHARVDLEHHHPDDDTRVLDLLAHASHRHVSARASGARLSHQHRDGSGRPRTRRDRPSRCAMAAATGPLPSRG